MNKRVLVLGVSLNSNRYSYHAIMLLEEKEFDVFAVGKKKGFIGKVKIVTDLIMVPKIHTITLYLNANNQKEYYNYIIDLKPKRVIFNPGTENAELEKLLIANNIFFENACTLVFLSTNQF